MNKTTLICCSLFIFDSLLPQTAVVSAAQRPPNILVAISDDQSYPHTSVYGTAELKTPAFDRVAHAGVLFENAFAASPGCSPSRAALLTGLHTWQIREAGTHASSFPTDFEVFPELLEQAGYSIGMTGKGWGPGDYKISGRTENPAGPAYSNVRLQQSPNGVSKTDYAANFENFLKHKPADQPFCFWYGGQEPHRSYQAGSGLNQGKDPSRVKVPEFLPDHPVIRSDLLDYYVEIEWFDQHLQQMLDLLEQTGELENTLVIVTADNGMPFPRAKANCYEYGVHVPLAICWPAKIPAQRTVTNPVGFVDLTATILQAAGVERSPRQIPLAGRSLLKLLTSEKSGRADNDFQAVYFARERHSSSRFNNWTYPQRALRTDQYLLIHNFRPDRWPAGDPQKFETNGKLGPPHGGYHDIDACPSLSLLIDQRENPLIAPYFHLAVDHRPEWELFDIKNDPACLHHLNDSPEHTETLARLQTQLNNYLAKTEDPRQLDGGEIYESYPRYSTIRKFPEPAH